MFTKYNIFINYKSKYMSSTEQWATIEGYEDYSVSNLGNIKNTFKNRPLKLSKHHTGGYYLTYLYDGIKRKGFLVHTLVAKYFIDNPLNKPQVNHIDGDKSNNTVNNLEWCTAQENMNHSANVLKNYDNHYKKITRALSEEQVLEICSLLKTQSYTSIAKKFNTKFSNISNIARFKTYKDITKDIDFIPYEKPFEKRTPNARTKEEAKAFKKEYEKAYYQKKKQLLN